MTELFVRAAELLNSDRGSVRLAGLIALTEIGQNHPERRQQVIDVICAYLRSPAEDLERGEERQIHLKAHRLLQKHLTEGDHFWPDMELNLIRATLLHFQLRGCRLRFGNFTQATFIGGSVDMGNTVFTKGVWLGETLIMSGGDNRDGDPELADATAPPGWRVEVNRGTGRSWFMQEPR